MMKVDSTLSLDLLESKFQFVKSLLGDGEIVKDEKALIYFVALLSSRVICWF